MKNKIIYLVRLISECVERIFLWVKNRCLGKKEVKAYA
jgi:hypothetical protein